jgi:hypothetical protein
MFGLAGMELIGLGHQTMIVVKDQEWFAGEEQAQQMPPLTARRSSGDSARFSNQ